MHSYEAFTEANVARGDIETVNKDIAKRIRENDGKVDTETTKLYARRMMKGLWLQYR